VEVGRDDDIRKIDAGKQLNWCRLESKDVERCCPLMPLGDGLPLGPCKIFNF